MPEPEINPYLPPVTHDQPPPSVDSLLAGPHPGRLRLAAIMLLANAACSLLEKVIGPKETGAGVGMFSVIIDVAIAISFFRGEDRYRGLAIFRVIAGMVVFSAINIYKGDYFTPFFMAIGLAGMLLVLVGSPRRGRLIAGAVLFGLLLLVEMVGLFVLSSGAGQ